MTKTEKLKLCSGCRNQTYNGHNTIGVDECWSLKSARLIKRVRVGLWERPPWEETEVKVLSCYAEEGPNRDLYMTLQEVRESNGQCRESIARSEQEAKS